MEIDLSQKKLINAKFKSMQTKTDLVELLNFAKRILYGQDCEPIRLTSLNYYANPIHCKQRYNQFTIPKKSGKNRVINAPRKGLKSILRVLNFVFQCVHKDNEHNFGFVPGKSIVDGAKIHVNQHYVYNIDLENFFHSFDRSKVKMGLMKNGLGMDATQEPIAFFIACLVTHPFKIEGEIQNVLPQGSPTSPTLTNIMTVKLDRRLHGLAKRFDCLYSRYADDITFSSSKNVFKKSEFKEELKRIVEVDQNLKIQTKKTRLLIARGRKRQEVTGLTVNQKVNVKKSYVKEIRMLLYYWETYGYKKANSIFHSFQKTNKNHFQKKTTNIKMVLSGKIEFLKTIKGIDDSGYLKLKSRYTSLIETFEDEALDRTQDIFLKDIEKKENNIFESTNDVFKEEPHGELNNIVERQKPHDKREHKQHEPRKLIELLNKFGSQTDWAKWSTHIWDGDDTINSYTELIDGISKKNYYKNFASIQNYNIDIWYRKIYPFLFQKKLHSKNGVSIPFHWGVHKIKIGWQYPSILSDWCKENTNSQGKWTNQPFNMELPEEIKPNERINGVSISTFYDVVELFKKEIEFKENDLYIQIRKLISEILPKFNIDTTKLKSLRSFVAYNNTEIIMKALKRIFKNIAERSNKNNIYDIEISTTFNGEDKFYELKIIHVHSESYTPLNHKKFFSSGGDLTALRKTLFGLCDFSIKGIFIEEDKRIFAQMDYLYDGCEKIDKEYSKPKVEKITEDPRGFNYILKFYT